MGECVLVRELNISSCCLQVQLCSSEAEDQISFPVLIFLRLTSIATLHVHLKMLWATRMIRYHYWISSRRPRTNQKIYSLFYQLYFLFSVLSQADMSVYTAIFVNTIG